MQAVHDYIIEINEKFKDHITLGSGQKIFVDSRFTYDKNANVLHTIKETPIVNSLNIQKGSEVIIDPIIMHQYIGWEGEKSISSNQLFISENLFKVSQRNIYFFKDSQTKQLFSPNDYVLAKKIEIKQPKSSIIFIPESNKPQYEQKKVILQSNSLFNKTLVHGTIATTNTKLGVPFYIEGEEFLIFREIHFFAVN